MGLDRYAPLRRSKCPWGAQQFFGHSLGPDGEELFNLSCAAFDKNVFFLVKFGDKAF